MREVLSDKLVDQAKKDKDFILLSGDHGYALFDALRSNAPDRFVNVGIMEQAMVGIASGLCLAGRKPVVYGLSAFVPTRVLEQIKMDVCYPKLPVKFIGDGAGVVYSYLGNSHFCAEDVACLSAIPHIEIYTPGDDDEMAICLEKFFASDKPAYLRVGKSDNPAVEKVSGKLSSILPYFSQKTESNIALVSMGSMNGICSQIAKEMNVSHVSVMQVKPLDISIVDMVTPYEKLIVVEEHHESGALKSILTSEILKAKKPVPAIEHIAFKDDFIHGAGTYQYVLSEHEMSFSQIKERVSKIVND